MKIQGAIFDLDGTLVDSLMFWDMGWRRIGEKYLNDGSFRPDPATDKAVRTAHLLEAMTIVHKNCGIAETGEELFEFVENLIVDFYTNVVKAKEGALEFLEYLNQKGVKMCVASATASNLVWLAMKSTGIDKYFDKVISCADIGKGKECPDVYIAAHEYLGTPKDSTWVFEDSVLALETAARAGFKTVGIYDKYNFALERIPEIADLFIDNGETLKQLIK